WLASPAGRLLRVPRRSSCHSRQRARVLAQQQPVERPPAPAPRLEPLGTSASQAPSRLLARGNRASRLEEREGTGRSTPTKLRFRSAGPARSSLRSPPVPSFAVEVLHLRGLVLHLQCGPSVNSQAIPPECNTCNTFGPFSWREFNSEREREYSERGQRAPS